MVHQPPLNPKRESQLIDQVRVGNRGALGELLGAYHKQVYQQCLRMVSNPSDAAELAQDTLMKVIEHIDDFRGQSKFRTWLFRIAMNVSISHLRKRKVRRAASLDGGESGGEDQAAALKMMIADEREPEPSLGVENRERVDRLMAAIDRLDVPLRSVILLRDMQEMDYEQIADVLGVPLGTVKSRLFRARLALRQAMVELERSPADKAYGADE